RIPDRRGKGSSEHWFEDGAAPRSGPTRPGRQAAGGHIVARNLPLFDHLVENPSALPCRAMTWPYNPDMQLTSRLDRRKLAAESQPSLDLGGEGALNKSTVIGLAYERDSRS